MTTQAFLSFRLSLSSRFIISKKKRRMLYLRGLYIDIPFRASNQGNILEDANRKGCERTQGEDGMKAKHHVVKGYKNHEWRITLIKTQRSTSEKLRPCLRQHWFSTHSMHAPSGKYNMTTQQEDIGFNSLTKRDTKV